ncbi:hypothetical protein CC85DRAFT_244920 [Cutaneotrichosporon oleaginosum]|uniref:B30.2/SPRY domain-containing protein n=1 Tax=Cutaneotrichosporon oleaginosum TaxID=879819 RepID=A0A0J0XPE0_9TREE|nr:uncharacterized protein CC85DRAFT_244920 [Cutaneotrichosporon oleaginosum]KLT42976.1 hypothetical protein CC85DRAFT_244920 [Cutaneotrichosporon oleaginosum]TXT11815.1 hypothetical protein COLE_02225 [Cutaneotrichosporon oleaginosum]
MKAPVPAPGSGDGGPADECYSYPDLPMNKTGYRYYACTLSPNPERGPTGPFYRTIPGPPSCAPVHISWFDRSAFLRISPDAATVTTDKGYRSGRANVSVREGSWYFEVVIERGDGAGGAGAGTGGEAGNAHVRVGWARREANLDAPVGACAYSYGVRDVGGEKVHISRPKPYGRGFATGDVVGCMITLPPRPPVESEDEPGFVKRWRIPVRYKGGNYFEMDEYPVAKEMEALVNRAGAPAPAAPVAEDHEPKKKVMKGGDKPSAKRADKAGKPVARELRTLPGSSVRFFLNGEEMADAPAFEDLYDFLPLPPNEEHRYVGPRRGPVSVERERESYQYHDDGTLGYFPMVSCFGRGKARVNFGPTWLKPPAVEARPLIERWDEFRAEEVVYDEREEARLAQRYKDMVSEAARPREPKRPAKKRRKTPHDGETPTSTPRMTPGITPAPSSPKFASSPAAAPSSPPSERAHSEGPQRLHLEQPLLDPRDHHEPAEISPGEVKPEPTEIKIEPGDDPHEGVSWS